MKAYKGFNKDMTCREFQFEEGKTYEEEEAKLCKRGFHACLNPLDCWSYYDCLNGVFHEVELEDVSDERNKEGSKICAKKITIGGKLDIKGIVSASVEFIMNSVKDSMNFSKGNNNSGYAAQIGSSGDAAQIGSSGDAAKIGSSGYAAQIGSSGDAAQIGSSGRYAQIGSSGDAAQIGSSGYAAQIGSSGRYAQIGSSGDDAQIECSSDHAVVVCAGKRAKVKAPIGTWITLAEYGEWDGEGYPCICVKSAQIDGEILKSDTWYTLENDEFVEAEG